MVQANQLLFTSRHLGRKEIHYFLVWTKRSSKKWHQLSIILLSPDFRAEDTHALGPICGGKGLFFGWSFLNPELVASVGSVFRTWISPLPCLGGPRTGLIVRNGAPPMPELLVLSLRLEPASNCPSLPQLQTGLFYPRSWVQLARAFFQLGSARGLHKVIYWFVTYFEPKYNHCLNPYFLTLFLKGAETFVWGCSQTQAELEL